MRDKNLILVVDDSPTVLHGTCRILRKAGYETIEASSGMDGLRLTIEHKPDLVLLDVVLPDIYGYEVCRRIKAELDLKGTLVILISSLDTHEDHETHGLEIGADGYIARPVSNNNLLAHIKSLLRLKTAEDNLRQSELKFRIVADFTYDWEYWIAPDGGILYMSPSSNRITGYQRDEFVNNPELLIDIIHKDDRANATDHLNHIELSGAHIVDFRIITRNGEARWIAHQCHQIVDDGGKFLGRRVSNRDITERKRMEEERLEMERQLLHAQKLESLGVMAGGIAHDFNNQLAVVLGNLELALLDLPPDSPARESIMKAVKAAKRSAQLSGQMRTYTGDTFYNPVELDLNGLLNKNLNQLKSSLPKNVTLNKEICHELEPIKGDPDQIQRLAMNILVNAAEAIGDQDGEVRISTGVMDCDEAYLRRSSLEEQPEPGRFVFLEVRDTGCGMDSGTQYKLLDPFFTTKFWGRGIGMAEVRGIVKGHRGAIIVDSKVGKGTTIRVLFPAADTSKM